MIGPFQLGILFVSHVAPYFPDPTSQYKLVASHLKNKTGITRISFFFFLVTKVTKSLSQRDLRIS